MRFSNEELRTAMDCLQNGAISTERINQHKVDWARLQGAYISLGGCPINRGAVAGMLEHGFLDNLVFSDDERAVIEAVLAELSL